MMLNQLLADLSASQITLFLYGDRLRYRAPERALTPQLRDRIAENRAAIIKRLRPEANVTTIRPPRCAVCNRKYWVDDPPKNGWIRTTCRKCRRFLGYRPEGLRGVWYPTCTPGQNREH